jgi:hypothetical protein
MLMGFKTKAVILGVGYFGGGDNAVIGFAEIDGINFSTEAVVNPSATLSVARSGLSGVSAPTKGYFAGGYTSNEIDGLNFVTITAINPSAVLVNPRIDTAGIQSTLKGYFCGGAQGNGDAVSEIDGINFSNDAGINPGAVLSENLWGSAGLKGPERRFKPR